MNNYFNPYAVHSSPDTVQLKASRQDNAPNSMVDFMHEMLFEVFSKKDPSKKVKPANDEFHLDNTEHYRSPDFVEPDLADEPESPVVKIKLPIDSEFRHSWKDEVQDHLPPDRLEEMYLKSMLEMVDSQDFTTDIGFLDIEDDNYDGIFKDFRLKRLNTKRNVDKFQNFYPENVRSIETAMHFYTNNYLAWDEQVETKTINVLMKSLTFSEVEMAKAAASPSLLMKKLSQANRMLKLLKSKSTRRWSSFKQRLRVYNYFFINRCLYSTNCLLVAWMVCFCTSVVQWWSSMMWS